MRIKKFSNPIIKLGFQSIMFMFFEGRDGEGNREVLSLPA
jgi:hypothetical protein